MPSYRAYQNDPIKQKARTAWRNMTRRCYCPQTRGFHRYGGRGIEICAEWYDSFLPFYEWSLENGIAFGLTIDRIDNDGNYSPDNCRWVTPKGQANNRSTNRIIKFNGERKTIQQWAEVVGISSQAMTERVESGLWSLEEGLTLPQNGRGRRYPALRKRVSQYSVDGELISTFDSVTAAAKATGAPTSNISRALTNSSTARGYYWKYATGHESRDGETSSF